MLTCEECGKLHPAGTLVCDVCGAHLAPWPYIAGSDLGAELGLDRLPPGSALGRVLAQPLRELTGALCPFCRQTNRPGASFCAFCGHTLVASPAASADGATPAGHLPPGALLHARYRVIRRVAQGGMGAVYEVADEQQPGLRLAVKEMVQTSLAPEERTQGLKDFMREATLLATLNHQNLPRFHDVFSTEGTHYLVMEFIPGQTLEQVVGNSRGFLPEARVLAWAAQLCDVLAYLHAADPPIIYRDMKPGNVMLVEVDDTIKLIDFGIARFHRRGRNTDTAAFGTAGYAPPEQYGNGQTDQRSDVYALAATLHHLLSGHDPVQNPFHWRPIRAFNPHVSRQVDQAILRALELKPELRWPSIDAFARALGMQPIPAAARVVTPLPLPAPAPVPATLFAPAPAPVPARPGLHAATPGGAPVSSSVGLPLAAASPSAPAAPVPPALPVTAAAPPAGPQLAVSDAVIDMGVAGRKARKGRPVRLLNAGDGQLKGIVRVTQPWLAVSAVQFQGNVGELTVAVRGRPRYGRRVMPVPNVARWAGGRLGHLEGRAAFLTWLALCGLLAPAVHLSLLGGLAVGVALPGVLLLLLQLWLWLVARHVRWLVPVPLVNTGAVVIDSNGGQRRVDVRVLAQPSWFRRALTWLFTSVLLVAELAAVLYLALTLLASALP